MTVCRSRSLLLPSIALLRWSVSSETPLLCIPLSWTGQSEDQRWKKPPLTQLYPLLFLPSYFKKAFVSQIPIAQESPIPPIGFTSFGLTFFPSTYVSYHQHLGVSGAIHMTDWQLRPAALKSKICCTQLDRVIFQVTGFSETHRILAEIPFSVHARCGGRRSKKDNRDDRQRDFCSWALSLAID